MEYLLLSLKLIGIVGAALGVSTHLAEPSENSTKRNKHLSLAVFSLLLSMSAEVLDTAIKRKGDQEETHRFERVLHPLGTMTISAEYTLALDTSVALQHYRDRLLKQFGPEAYSSDRFIPLNDPHMPRGTDEQPALDALTAWMGTTIDIYKSHAKRKPRVLAMHFSMQEPDALKNSKTYTFGEGEALTIFDSTQPFATMRYFQFDPARNKIKFSDGNVSVGSDDRSSNGDIVAQSDLEGAEVEVQICPEFRTSRSSRGLKGYFDLSRLSIMLPGSIGCTVGEGKNAQLKSLPPLEFADTGLECKKYGFTFLESATGTPGVY